VKENYQIKKQNRGRRKDLKSLRFWREKNFRVNKKKGNFEKFKKRQKRAVYS